MEDVFGERLQEPRENVGASRVSSSSSSSTTLLCLAEKLDYHLLLAKQSELLKEHLLPRRKRKSKANRHGTGLVVVEEEEEEEYYINFQNAESQLALTRALLAVDFGLDLQLDVTLHLIPPIPTRFLYVRWIDTLVRLLPIKNGKGNDCTIVDIGTGASCVYALLGAKHFGWNFHCTDIDETIIKQAQRNIFLNALDQKIKVNLVENSLQLQTHISSYLSLNGDNLTLPFHSATDADKLYGPIINALLNCENTRVQTQQILESDEKRDMKEINDDVMVDACMCNPPFYDYDEHINTVKGHAICTGNEMEMRTSGGEVAFVTGFIHDSLLLRNRIGWYTSLLGKKASIKTLVKILKDHGVSNIRTTTFISGTGRTHRWGLAWSLGDQGKEELQGGAHNVLSKKRKRKAMKFDEKDDCTEDTSKDPASKKLNRRERRKLKFAIVARDSGGEEN